MSKDTIRAMLDIIEKVPMPEVARIFKPWIFGT